VNLSKDATSPSTSFLSLPLGRTPPYLDPQSQEAVYEVDVSGMPIDIHFDMNQSGQTKDRDERGK